MNHASIPVAGAVPAPVVIAGKKSKPTGFLARIGEALHQSRRTQAQRFLWAHRHLIAPSKAGDKNVDR
jgi:hypothetical protein